MTGNKPDQHSYWVQIFPAWWPIIVGCLAGLVWAGAYWRQINDHLESLDKQVQAIQVQLHEIRTDQIQHDGKTLNDPPPVAQQNPVPQDAAGGAYVRTQ